MLVLNIYSSQVSIKPRVVLFIGRLFKANTYRVELGINCILPQCLYFQLFVRQLAQTEKRVCRQMSATIRLCVLNLYIQQVGR